MTYAKLTLAFTLITFFAASVSMAAGIERDPLAPRVPPDEMRAAQQWKNPFNATPGNIAKGRILFQGRGTCHTCHGMDGRGDGFTGLMLDPAPRNFHNRGLKRKTDGEFMFVIKHGIAGTGMMSYVPGVITEEEAALILLYERSLHDIR